MRAHTKKLHTEKNSSVKAHDEDDSLMSADEAIAKICGDRPKWSVMLRGLRNREGLTQSQLGEVMGIAQTNISQMERGVRAIGKQLAKRFAAFFKTDYRLFL